ncbi:hypothetical protein I656_00072 [Geobacillus sp. WSUCF1]|nr:hypothetical protein I656_00072 [Geobacillus sp. WSUCF1]
MMKHPSQFFMPLPLPADSKKLDASGQLEAYSAK